MRDPHQTLEAIDGVLSDWHGSDDAMAWTAKGAEESSTGGCVCGPDDACPVCMPCDICRDGAVECGCDGETDYADRYVCCSGYRVPDHCCGCGGSPYCAECHRCGATCFGDCTCPVTVQLESGGTLTL